MQNTPKKHSPTFMQFLSSSTFLVVLGILLIGVAIIFWQVQEASNLDRLAEETAALTRSYARESEFRFDRIEEALQLLANQASVMDQDTQLWKDDADFYLHGFTGLETIALVGETYQVREIVPQELEATYRGESAANFEGRTSQIHIWIPIYDGTVFKGFIVGILDIGSFMQPVIEEIAGDYDLQLTEEGITAFETTTPFTLDERFAASQPITLKNETVLQLTIIPSQSMMKTARMAASNNFIFSLMGAALTLGAVFVAQNFNKLAKANQQRYSSLFAASRDAIFVIDTAGKYQEANAAALDLVGYSLAELRKMTVNDILHLQNSPPSYDRAKLWSEGGQVEIEVRHKDGHAISVEMTISPFQVQRQQSLVIGIARNISERKELEAYRLRQQEQLEQLVATRTVELQERVGEVEKLNTTMNQMLAEMQSANQNLAVTQKQLQTSNEELEAFSYSVSHDLRAPLRHIDGFLHLLLEREKLTLDETSQHYLKNVIEATNRMGALINNLLELSRTTRTQLKYATVNTQEMVQSVIEELNPVLENRTVDFQIDALPPVIGDQGLLRAVWMNLINNAIKFTAHKENAIIQISAQPTKEGDQVTFSVKDNGAGYNPAYSEKLFMVFQRLHNESEFQGSGIGLATVKRIINRHGGDVWADGEEGVGATFYFTLIQAQARGAKE